MTNTMRAARFFTLIAALVATTSGAEEVPQPQVEFLDPPPTDSVLVDEAEPAHKKFLVEEELLDLWDGCPAPVESTGTWLRRGWWSAQIDAVVFIRKWDRQNAVLAADNGSLRALVLARTVAPEASARLRLGRFLFRDLHNRDHTVEFSVMGGSEFNHRCRLESVSPNNIATPASLDLFGSPNFDGASSTEVQYASRLNTFEWNYKVTSRMRRDRMELQPDGRWIRRAQHSLTYHGLIGLRYTDLTENVFWTAENIVSVDANGTALTGETGSYDVHTSNDAFGFQGGGGVSLEFDRFSLTLFTRGGVMFNDAKMRSDLVYFDPTTGTARTDVGFNKDARDGSLPLVVQGGVLGRYHLRPNISIRGGYEFMYLTAMALAPHHLEFKPDNLKVGRTATPFYHGLTLGAEFYW